MALSRIQTADIADNAVTTVKVDDGAVIGTDILDGTIINSMIVENAAIPITCLSGLGAGVFNVGTGANQILQLNGSGDLPALDGSALTGIVSDFTPIENSLARLGLHLGAVEQLAKFNMIDQVIDDYEDATGVTAENSVAAVPAIPYSCRFTRASSDDMSKASLSGGSTTKGTQSWWFKRASISSDQRMWANYSGSSTARNQVGWQATNKLYIQWADTTVRISTQTFTSTTAWVHIVVAWDSTQATAADRLKVYIDGTEITAWDTNAAPTQNADMRLNNGKIYLGRRETSSLYLDAHMADFRSVDGQQLTPSTFGQTVSGVWKPKTVTGLTYGTNGFYLDFADSSALGNDVSGNNKDFTVANLTSGDRSTDTPQPSAVVATANTGSSSSAELQGSAGAKYYSGSGSTTVAPAYATGNQQSVVTMTSNASIYNYTGDPDTALGFNQIFDGDTTTILSSSAFVFGTGTQPTSGKYLRFQFTAPAKRITEATFWHHYSGSVAGLGTWQWQGSNDGSTWTTIGNTFALTAPAAGQVLTELSGNTNYYTWYQMLGISGTISDYPYVKELQFKRGQIDTTTGINQTLISTTTTAQTAPTKASIVLQTEDATGTATINTDVKAGVSRDALNYVDTTLAKIGTWGSGNVYAANDVVMPGTVMAKAVTVRSSAGGNKFHIDEIITPATAGAYVTGNRSSSITVTIAGMTTGGAITNLVDGSNAGGTGTSFYFNASSPATDGSAYVRFQFSTTRIITEAKYRTSTGGYPNGTWRWQGSNDASSWTNIGNTFVLATGAADQLHTELNGNTTSYTYYQMTFVSGSVNASEWQLEIEFKEGYIAAIYSNQQPTLTATEGYTYKFDQSDSTNSGHPLRFSTTSNGTHASGTEYTTGVTTSGTPGSAGAYTQIVVAASAPTLYYYCSNHSGMGGTANTPAEAATTSMRYRVDTKNQSGSKITRIHGTSLAWK